MEFKDSFRERMIALEEKNKVIHEAEKAYNREVRLRRKMMTFDKVAASMTL